LPPRLPWRDRRRRLRPLLAAALDRGSLRAGASRQRRWSQRPLLRHGVHGEQRRRLISGTLQCMSPQEQTGEPITQAGIEELKAELAELEGPARKAMAARIKVAREEGDLKENAEYHVAKEDQAHMETKIKRLQ